ncbi:hypothetical protein ACHAWO_012318 [Cyclotella atomus]|uniref:Zinc finger CHCC-type domain-containing protein n=1 Tax=Cyclotella atomus TaxID=382360 RepID=A0ABD3QIY3_9STRA
MPQTRSRGSRRHGSTAPHPSANPADQFALAFGTDDVSNTHRGTDDTPESQNNEGDGSTSPTGNNNPNDDESDPISPLFFHSRFGHYKLGKHRSNALKLVNKVPPIEVEGDMAICDGAGGALGHPIEYIKVGYHGGKPVSYIYCGLKFVQKNGGHH